VTHNLGRIGVSVVVALAVAVWVASIFPAAPYSTVLLGVALALIIELTP
jgi:hypothetical protein